MVSCDVYYISPTLICQGHSEKKLILVTCYKLKGAILSTFHKTKRLQCAKTRCNNQNIMIQLHIDKENKTKEEALLCAILKNAPAYRTVFLYLS